MLSTSLVARIQITFAQSISASLRAVRRSRYIPVGRLVECGGGGYGGLLTFTEGDQEGIEDAGPHRLEIVQEDDRPLSVVATQEVVQGRALLVSREWSPGAKQIGDMVHLGRVKHQRIDRQQHAYGFCQLRLPMAACSWIQKEVRYTVRVSGTPGLTGKYHDQWLAARLREQYMTRNSLH